MEQNKTKILSDLYAIRATMSLIAENDDCSEAEKKEMRAIEAQIRDEDKKFAQECRPIKTDLESMSYATNLAEAQKKLEIAKKDLQYAKENFESDKRNRRELQNESKHSLAHFFTFVPGDIWWGYFVTCIILFLIACLVCFVGGNMPLELRLTLVFACPAGIVFFVIHPIVYLIMHSKKIGVLKEYEEKYYFRSKTKFEERQNAVAELEKTILMYQNALDRKEVYLPLDEVQTSQTELQQKEQAHLKQIQLLNAPLPQHQKTITEIATRSKLLVNSSVQAYPLIDFRDWENVDLLIFYFETGRADNMKEALQLVDRQRQTDQITTALAMASASICKTIYQSMNQLGSALARAFSFLSRQIAQQHGELIRGLENQAAEQRAASKAQLDAIQAQTAAQVSAQAMNQALLDKISVSSAKLAEQVDRQMKQVYGLY